ncbi:DUF1752-domain-containing protein [Thozetella sp. PMI_491]|nr:DUF1752-domain-containing protein [Thozetella sp. PMI_491]
MAIWAGRYQGPASPQVARKEWAGRGKWTSLVTEHITRPAKRGAGERGAILRALPTDLPNSASTPGLASQWSTIAAVSAQHILLASIRPQCIPDRRIEHCWPRCCLFLSAIEIPHRREEEAQDRARVDFRDRLANPPTLYQLATISPLLDPRAVITTMPIRLQAPVLQVDANVIHKVDTSNPENLFSMWTVFAKCADSVAQGRRLENLSWRLWNRETLYCEDSREEEVATSTASTAPKDIQKPKRTSVTEDLPQLSGSVESLLDEEAVEFTTDATPVDILRPRIQRQDSCASSRRRHITSDSLEKMVVSIVEAKVPFDAPLPNITASFPLPTSPEKPSATIATVSHPELQRSGSTTTEASPSKTSEASSVNSLQQHNAPVEISSSQNSQGRTTVVRGFTPVPLSMSSRILSAAKLPSPSAIPEPTAAPPPKIVQPRKAKFALGGSSGDDDSYSDHSLETRKQPVPQIKKMFQIGGSSGDDSSLKSALGSASPAKLGAPRKTASFSQQPVTQTYQDTSAVDDDQSETDYVDESAIDDDDDSSDWEDSMEDSGKSSMEEINFKRVDSTANLTSRRSLITLMLTQNDRVQKRGGPASQPVSHMPRARSNLNGPSLAPSPNDSDDAALMMMRAARPPPMRSINEIPRSAAQPIMTTTSGMHHQAALSPRTTRRNMLATELTESLRRHLLWERSQKTSTANAVLKRRHTSHDVANLKQFPEKPYMKDENNDVNSSSFDQYFNREPFTGYHTQGW